MNSQKSTGPRTTAGKAASRYNALKHGIFATTQIMFDEKAEDLAELAAEYHEHHSPADPDQRFLVDTLVNNEWRLRRLRRVEAELWGHATTAILENNAEAPACSSGDAFATAAPIFDRLQRVVNSCDRTYHRALKELRVARAHGLRSPELEAEPTPQAAPAPTPVPQSQQSTPTSAKMASSEQKPETPPSAPPFAGPLASQHAPASPAETSPQPSNRSTDPDGSN